MPDTLTPNYGLVKPEIDGSPDTWGQKLNGNLDTIDQSLKIVADVANAAMPKTGGEFSGAVSNTANFSTTATPTSPQHLSTVGLVRSYVENVDPVGIVKMWAGTIASIPANHKLCDGGTYDGVVTPNLTDRFIVAASSAGTYQPGFFGGSDTHNHGGSVGDTTLGINQIPSHNHGGATGDNSVVPNYRFTNYGNTTLSTAPPQYNGLIVAGENTAPVTNGVHTHPISAQGGGQAHNHSIASASNVPRYYALAFIMRTKYPWTA